MPKVVLLTGGLHGPPVNNSILSKAKQSKANDGKAKQSSHKVALLTGGLREPPVNNSILSKAKQTTAKQSSAAPKLYC